jgi:Tol biopolymer transport system component
MRRNALLVVLCVITSGFSGGGPTQDRSQGRLAQILLVVGADSDEPAGPLAVVRADGSGFRRLTSTSALEARWSPDGRRIAFIAADNVTPRSSVWVMNADGHGRRQLVPDSAGYSRVLEWSPDGRRILYDLKSDLWSMRADGSDKRLLVPDVNPIDVTAIEGDWSPGGRSIAFANAQDIYVMRADGSDLVRVAAGGVSPAWTRDGKRILFVRKWQAPRPGVYAVAAAGGKARRVAPLPGHDGLYLAGISPDGRSVLVGSYPGLAKVFLRGGTVRRLTRRSGDYGGDWSPDGRRIAFLRGLNLWVMDADGRNAHLVRRAPGYKQGARLQGVFTLAMWKPRS